MVLLTAADRSAAVDTDAAAAETFVRQLEDLAERTGLLVDRVRRRTALLRAASRPLSPAAAAAIAALAHEMEQLAEALAASTALEVG